MKKIYLICAGLIAFHAGTTTPMMERFNKALKPIYGKYLKRTPAPYIFYDPRGSYSSYAPYAPRDSYSYFSPHFNMYHYVGMDYTAADASTLILITQHIQQDLAIGIRGFKFKDTELMILRDKNTRYASLSTIIREIAIFAEKHNELVIVHLVDTEKYENIITELIKKQTDIHHLFFTPSDQLKDIEKNAAKNRIKNTANKNGLTVWPRLKWNYANQKLVMITWDSKLNSDYCWNYDTYFTHNLNDSKKLIESNVSSISAAMPKAANDQPTIFYSDVLKAELITGLSFITLLAANMISNYLYSLYSQPISYQPPFNPMDWINNPSIIPANAKQTFDVILAKTRTFGPENPNNPLNLNNEGLVYLRYRLKELFTPQRVYTYYPSRFLSLWTNLIASVGSGLTALGIYAIGHTKNAFTVVKVEEIPANMAVNGVFLTKPLTPTDITTIKENRSSIFNAVSKLNKDDYKIINDFQRSLWMKIAHHGRRAVSPITNRLRKKR